MCVCTQADPPSTPHGIAPVRSLDEPNLHQRGEPPSVPSSRESASGLHLTNKVRTAIGDKINMAIELRRRKTSRTRITRSKMKKKQKKEQKKNIHVFFYHRINSHPHAVNCLYELRVCASCRSLSPLSGRMGCTGCLGRGSTFVNPTAASLGVCGER